MTDRMLPLLLLLFLLSCADRNSMPSKETISGMHLKQGALITCGPPGKEFGTVAFETSCKGASGDFNLAMALLHSSTTRRRRSLPGSSIKTRDAPWLTGASR
jgi:hypothetical protein